MTTEVGRLIAKGLLTKQASTRDRRSVLVRLSRKGEAAIRSVNPLLRRVNDRLFQNVGREEFAVVSRFLEKFARNSEDALEGNPALRPRARRKQPTVPCCRAGLITRLNPCLPPQRPSPSADESMRMRCRNWNVGRRNSRLPDIISERSRTPFSRAGPIS